MRKKHRTNIPQTVAMKSTILTHDSQSSNRQPRSRAIDRPNPNSHLVGQSIQEIYGRVNRFRTLRKERDQPMSSSKNKDSIKVTLNNSKIENSFNNIIINFSQRHSAKGALINTLNPRPDEHKLVAERRVRSKEIQRISEVRRYAKSKVLSQRADQLSSSSIVVKEKLISLNKARKSIRSSNHKVRKSQIQTLQDQHRPASRPISINNSLGKLENVVSNFVMTFQQILNEPISLQTYETKQMKLQNKMKKSACQILKRFQKRWLSEIFKTISKTQL